MQTISFEAVEETVDDGEIKINECGTWCEPSAVVESRTNVEEVARHQLQEIVPGPASPVQSGHTTS